ncbi:MAG: hypothetical protein AAF196_02880 [Planctomycetota bacterium]
MRDLGSEAQLWVLAGGLRAEVLEAPQRSDGPFSLTITDGGMFLVEARAEDHKTLTETLERLRSEMQLPTASELLPPSGG